MEKSAKVKRQVIILEVPWRADSEYVGRVVKLDNIETASEWATATVDGVMVVISKYIIATELNKALI